MRKFLILIIFALLAIAGYAQNNTRVVKGMVYNAEGTAIVGATIKAIGEDVAAVSGQGGVFEMRVSPYCQYIEASYEGMFSAKGEIDGSLIIFRLKTNKKYWEEKAKIEEQARLAAEKEAAAKAKAEEQARLAAEKEAAAKAKAEEQARIAAEKEAAAKAKAEEQARIAAEKEAQTKAVTEQNLRLEAEKKTQSEATAGAKAEKQIHLSAERNAEKTYKQQETMTRVAALGEIKLGYAQYVNLGYSYGLEWKRHSAYAQYIGGYRFNKNLFLGIGTGVNIGALVDKVYQEISYQVIGYHCIFMNSKNYCSAVSIPVFAHFRSDFARRNRVNPFAALSAGDNIDTTPAYKSAEQKIYNHALFGDCTVGVNYRLSPKTDLYFGVTCGLSFRNGGVGCTYDKTNQTIVDYWDTTSQFELDDISLKFNIGISF